MAVILTDQCNFHCSYCYEPGGKQRLDFSTLVKALNFLRPFMAPKCSICFYGGEPLLEFETLKRAVEHLERSASGRKPGLRYSLATNGSLLTEDVLGFLRDHEFSLMLSFDGLAQDSQRKRRTFDHLASLVPKILAGPGIFLETNSVFGADTVGLLSGSVRLLIDLAVPKIDINFAHKPAWTDDSLLRLEDQLRRVGDDFLARFERSTDIPWPAFSQKGERGGVHQCSAGWKQMALSAQGTLWGCAVFPHYFGGKRSGGGRDYCFGPVDSFIEDPQRLYPQKMAHYSRLSMDRFATRDRACRNCPEIEECWSCPLAAALSTGEIGKIPVWSCRAGEIFRKERRLFLDRFEKKLQRRTRPVR